LLSVTVVTAGRSRIMARPVVRGTARIAVLTAALGLTAICRQQASGFATLGSSTQTNLQLGTRTGAAAPAAVAAPLISSSTSAPLPALAAVAALLLGGCRGRIGAAKPAASSRVVMHARNPFPEAPASQRNKRRTAAGTRAFFKGRQLSVRVNKKTNKAITFKMHVRTGDTVQVMKGKDAGKVTTVLKIYKKWNRVLCLGVNFCIKHVRPQREDQVGQRVQVEAAMHSSNVMHYSEKENAVGNLGYRYEEIEGKLRKVRYNKATGETLEDKKAPEWVPVLERTTA